ncbi:MAG: hypothetical protein RL577_289 [Bacteroidota bacterium]|jgi:chromate reductase
MKIAILCCSSRAHSNTARVGKAIQNHLESKHPELDVFRPDFVQYDIPFFNEKALSPDDLSPFQGELVNALEQSHLVFLLSPEYNWFPSAEAVNMIHQLGSGRFRACWNNKVWATVGVSSGRGGRIPAVQLSYVINKVIGHLNLQSVVSAKNFESQFTPQVLTAEGQSMGHDDYDKGLFDFIEYNLDLAKKMLA